MVEPKPRLYQDHEKVKDRGRKKKPKLDFVSKKKMKKKRFWQTWITNNQKPKKTHLPTLRKIDYLVKKFPII